jgi:hypothetical protein
MRAAIRAGLLGKEYTHVSCEEWDAALASLEVKDGTP